MNTVPQPTDSAPVFSPTFDFEKDQERVFTATVLASEIREPRLKRWVRVINQFDSEGEPVRGFVRSIDGDYAKIQLTHTIGCALPWCEGHSWNEADNWDDLHHWGKSISLGTLTPEDVLDTVDDDHVLIARALLSGTPSWSFDIAFAGTVGQAGAAQLADNLEAAARRIRAEIKSAEEV